MFTSTVPKRLLDTTRRPSSSTSVRFDAGAAQVDVGAAGVLAADDLLASLVAEELRQLAERIDDAPRRHLSQLRRRDGGDGRGRVMPGSRRCASRSP